MMREIEAKFYKQDLNSIEMRLQELRAHLIQPRVSEKNIRCDLCDGRFRSKGHKSAIEIKVKKTYTETVQLLQPSQKGFHPCTTIVIRSFVFCRRTS